MQDWTAAEEKAKTVIDDTQFSLQSISSFTADAPALTADNGEIIFSQGGNNLAPNRSASLAASVYGNPSEYCVTRQLYDLYDEVMTYLAYYPDYYEVLTVALNNAKDSVKIGEDNYLAAEAENGGYVKSYGFLYSYDAALKAVPDGWRLPTDDDFTTLERTLGLPADEAGLKEAWRGEGLATLLNEGGASGFNAKCGGGNTYIIKANGNNYMGKDENWYYWTSTMDKQKDSVDVAIIRMSAIYTNKVWRGTSPLTTGYRDVTYSVRCVKDAIKVDSE